MWSNSYVEIVLTGAGFQFMNTFVFFLTGVGGIYAAFAFVMVKTYWRERHNDFGYNGQAELTRHLMNSVVMMIVVIFFWLPHSSFKFDTESYLQNFDAEAVTVYEKSFSPPETAPSVPPAVYFVLSLYKASANQIIEVLDYDDSATRAFTQQNAMAIKNPRLRTEVTDFINQCYRPALRRYLKSVPPESSQLLDELNLRYLGNETFVNTPGLYRRCSTGPSQFCINNSSLNGHMRPDIAKSLGIQTEYLTSADYENQVPEINYTDTPNCYEWWTGKSVYSESNFTSSDLNSLRDRLFEVAKDEVTFWVATFDKQDEDELIARLLENSEAELTPKRVDGDGGIIDAIQSSLAGLGAIWESFKFSMMLELLRPGILILNAALIMIFLTVYPVIILLSGFSLSTTLKMLVYLFGLTFLPVLFHIADMINNNLLMWLFPNEVNEESVFFFTSNSDLSTQVTLIGIVSFLLYFVMPIIFFKLMGAAGHQVDQGMTGLNDKLTGGAMTAINAAGKKKG